MVLKSRQHAAFRRFTYTIILFLDMIVLSEEKRKLVSYVK